jgi:hypothetical protein
LFTSPAWPNRLHSDACERKTPGPGHTVLPRQGFDTATLYNVIDDAAVRLDRTKAMDGINEKSRTT